MKPVIYLETSIISYLTARPSRDLVRAAHQEGRANGFEPPVICTPLELLPE